MTKDEIKEIEILQKRGIGYTRIANITKLPLNTVKSYVARHPIDLEDVSLCCGSALEHKEGKKIKSFVPLSVKTSGGIPIHI